MSGPRAGGPPAAVTPVGLGQAALGTAGDELVAYGLGSCIGLALWCPRLAAGVLCHVVLPDSGGTPPDPSQPARYADWAVSWAVAALRVLGARPEELVAKWAGGASVLPLPTDVGRQNAEAVARALATAGVRPGGHDVGGTVGRTVRFWPASGVLEVRPLGLAPRRL